jgi:hypothetical protein
MDDRHIKSILQDALEDEIPAAEIDLLPAVRSRILAGKKSTHRQGERMNRTFMRRLTLPAVTVIALLALALVSPQGRAFAQSILQFFTRAESHTLPLPSEQIAPTGNAGSMPTAEPPAPLISLTEAEAQAGFDALELPAVPRGFEYLGARLYGNAISIEYQAQGGGGHLIIMQSQESFLQSDWDQVPAEAIVPVKIGGLDGEFTQGTFVVYPNDTTATWNPDAPILRLRWVRDGIWFEMTRFGGVESIAYLDGPGLISLAESLR